MSSALSSYKTVSIDDWEKLKNEGVASDTFQNALIKTAKLHNVAIEQMIQDEGSFQATLKNGWLSLDILKETIDSCVEGVSESSSDLSDKLEEIKELAREVINGNWGNGSERRRALTEAGRDYETIQSMVNNMLIGTEFNLEKLTNAELEAIGFTNEEVEALRELGKTASETGTPLNELITSLEKPSGRELIIDSAKNALHALLKILGSVRKAWSDVFTPVSSEFLYNIIDGIHKFSEKLIISDDTADKLSRTFKGLFSIVKILTTFIGGTFSKAFSLIRNVCNLLDIDILGVTASIGDAIVAFKDWIINSNLFSNVLEKVISFIKTAITVIKDWITQILSIPKVQEALEKFFSFVKDSLSKTGDYFKEGVKKVDEFIGRLKSMDKINLSDIGNVIKGFKDNISSYFLSLGGRFNGFKSTLASFKDAVFNCFKAIGDYAATLRDKISDKVGLGEILAIGIGVGIMYYAKKSAMH